MSNTNIARAKAKLQALNNSLDELESCLEPLLAQPLPEILSSLDNLQQAKLYTTLPYVVYDLIFVYLKARGIDPRTHPVISELDRVRQYFEKISSAEESAQPRMTLDKAAAGRFIKHAITQAKQQATTGPSSMPENEAGPSSSNVRVPIKVTAKMKAREEYEKEMREMDEEGEEEGELEVFDEAAPSEAEAEAGSDAESVVLDKVQTLDKKGKRKQPDSIVAQGQEVSEQIVGARRVSRFSKKRRRRAKDGSQG